MNNHVVAVLLLSVVGSPSTVRAQDSAEVLSWFVQVEGGTQNSAQPRTFRLFEEVDSIAVHLILDNESSRPVRVSRDQLATSARITLNEASDNRAVDTVSEWTRCAPGRDSLEDQAVSTDPLTIKTGELTRCRILIRRADGSRFRWGVYTLAISLEAAAHSLRNEAGGQWGGRYLPNTELTLIVGPARSSAEIASKHLLAGDAALEAKRPQEAVAHYRAGLAMHPAHTSLQVGLGQAYMEMGQYREAATVYERLLPVLQGKHTAIVEYLAHAYVGAGDERRAKEVLARGGMSGERITAKLVRYRELVARKSGKLPR